MSASHALPDGPLVAFYGDDFTGSSAAMEALAFAGPANGAVPRTADAGAPAAFARLPRHRHRRRRALARPRMDGPAPAAGLRAAAVARRAGRALQGLLDLRLRPPYRLHRARRSTSRARICSAAGIPMVVGDPGMGRFQAFGHLFALAQRRRIPARPAPDHVAATRSRRWTRPTSAGIWRSRRTRRSASSTSSP